MKVYHLKEIRRITSLSLKQQLNYYEKGFLIKKVDHDGKIIAYEEDLKRIFQIKALKNMGFSLNQITIIFKHASDNKIMNLIEEYLRKEQTFLNNLFKIFKDCKNHQPSDAFFSKNLFGYLWENIFCKYYLFDLFDNRKKAKSEAAWKPVRLMRKNMFAVFKDYSPKTFNKQALYVHFNIIEQYLINQIICYSILHFIAFFCWLQVESRYVKELKLIAGFNLSKELANYAIEWILQKY